MSEVIRPDFRRANWQSPDATLEVIRELVNETEVIGGRDLVQYINGFGQRLLINKDLILEINRDGEILRLELGDEVAFALVNESQERKRWIALKEDLKQYPETNQWANQKRALVKSWLGL